MAKKLYVGGLPYATDDAALKEAFAKHGEVLSASVIVDKMTGRSRGFGFVEMEDDAAQAAISALDGTELEGRTIKVNEAKPREDRPRGGGGGRGGFGGGRGRGGGGGGYGGGGRGRGGDRGGGGGNRW
ncbi:MAG: RNA-binding protein [Deltaproteobacteria bacterium]|nr:RNA-binding protein [Deltaproteobacteria bacterium]